MLIKKYKKVPTQPLHRLPKVTVITNQDYDFAQSEPLEKKALHAAVLAATDFPCSLPPTSVALATTVPNAAICATANRWPYPSDIAIVAIAPDAADSLAAVGIYAAAPDAADALTDAIAAVY